MAKMEEGNVGIMEEGVKTLRSLFSIITIISCIFPEVPVQRDSGQAKLCR